MFALQNGVCSISTKAMKLTKRVILTNYRLIKTLLNISYSFYDSIIMNLIAVFSYFKKVCRK